MGEGRVGADRLDARPACRLGLWPAPALVGRDAEAQGVALPEVPKGVGDGYRLLAHARRSPLGAGLGLGLVALLGGLDVVGPVAHAPSPFVVSLVQSARKR